MREVPKCRRLLAESKSQRLTSRFLAHELAKEEAG